jgi:hypothetical protein
MLVEPEKVLQEVDVIRHSESWRRSVYGEEGARGFSVRVPVRDADGSIAYPDLQSSSTSDYAAAAATVAATAAQAALASVSSSEDALTYALTQWCDAIASPYGVPVFNLTNCLSDGRALCLLVHYYHPSILPTGMIQATTVALMNQQYFTNTGEPSAVDDFMEVTFIHTKKYYLFWSVSTTMCAPFSIH